MKNLLLSAFLLVTAPLYAAPHISQIWPGGIIATNGYGSTNGIFWHPPTTIGSAGQVLEWVDSEHTTWVNPSSVSISNVAPKLNGIYYVRDFGAKADGVALDDVSITNGSSKFFSPSASLSSADIGKGVMVYTNLSTALSYTSLAGNNVSNVTSGYLLTTISSVEGPNNATLSDTSLGSVNTTRMIYGTDNSVSVQAAINASLGGELWFERGVYFFNGPIQNPLNQNSVLTIPIGNTNQTFITLKGIGNSFGYYTGYNPTYSSTNGTVLFCATKGTTAYPAFIGANPGLLTNFPTPTVTQGPSGSPFSSVALNLDGIQFMTPANAQIGIINAYYGGGLIARNCTFMNDFWGNINGRVTGGAPCAGVWAPTSTNAFGVIVSGESNNGQEIIDNCWFFGLWLGLRTGDHTDVKDSFFQSCNIGIGNPYLGGHMSAFNTAIQATKYAISGLSGITAIGLPGGEVIADDVWLENNQNDLYGIVSAKVTYLANQRIVITPSIYASGIEQNWRHGGADSFDHTMNDLSRDGFFTFKRNLADNYFFNEIARFYSSTGLVSSLHPDVSSVSMYGESNATKFGWSIVDWTWQPLWSWFYDRNAGGVEFYNIKSNLTPFVVTESAARNTLVLDSTRAYTWSTQPPSNPLNLSNAVPAVTNFSLGVQFVANSDLVVTDLGAWFNAIHTNVAVGLWKEDTTLLASGLVLSNTAVATNFNFVSITPVTLKSGQLYRVAMFSGNTEWYWSETFLATSDATPLSGCYDTTATLGFPVLTNTGSFNAYGPPNFKYHKNAAVTVNGGLQASGGAIADRVTSSTFAFQNTSSPPDSNAFYVAFGNSFGTTNHILQVVTGSLSNYWCNGTNVYSSNALGP